MPKRTIPRLAYCEYINPNDQQNNTVAWTARLEMMRSVKRLYPTILEGLSKDVFPHYAELAASGFNFDAILWNPRRSYPSPSQ